MQPAAGNPFLERLQQDPRRQLRIWLVASYCVAFAGGYLRFETSHPSLGRLLVAGLATVLLVRLVYFFWTLNRLDDAQPMTQADHDAFWARLTEERKRRWERLEPRGRAHYVWIITANLAPLLIGSFFAILVLVGPEYLQIASNPPVRIGVWGTLAVATLAALPLVVVKGVRDWDRAVESWRQHAVKPQIENGEKSESRPPA